MANVAFIQNTWREFAGVMSLSAVLKAAGHSSSLFVEDREKKIPGYQIGKDVTDECLKNGLLFSLRRGGSVLRFVPPFCTTDDEIERAYEILDNSIKVALDMRFSTRRDKKRIIL